MVRRTIGQEISVAGRALHSGATVDVTVAPAPPGAGIVFRRSDLGGAEIPALYDRVSETRLGTVISEGQASVALVEHLMAAVAGAEIDDLRVIVGGPELPILNGDALSYLDLLDQAGISESALPAEGIKVLRRVEVRRNEAVAALEPCSGREFDIEITFASAVIGRQRLQWRFEGPTFRRDIAPARTFGFVHELETLNKAGLARGATLENTLAIDGDRLLNQDLLRFQDEFVRHKILDAIGDLALAGSRIIGRFQGCRSGHALNNELLRALFSDPANHATIRLD